MERLALNERLYRLDGRVVVDRVYRYEDLPDAVADISSRLGLDLDLPHAKQGSGPHYRELYGPGDAAIVGERFARTIRGNVPWFGIIASTVLAMVFMWISYGAPFFGNFLTTEDSGLNVFLTLVYLTGVTAAIPYFFSALAQVYWLFTEHRVASVGRLVWDLTVSIMAMLFSVWFVYGSGAEATSRAGP